jgi:hypothetical protein
VIRHRLRSGWLSAGTRSRPGRLNWSDSICLRSRSCWLAMCGVYSLQRPKPRQPWKGQETGKWNEAGRGEESREARFEMAPIRARLHNRELANEITALVCVHIDDTESKPGANLRLMQIGERFDTLTTKVGEEIRRLEDAGL